MPFPPYAYVPGHWPHPTRDPDGHSFNLPEAPSAPLDPQAWQLSAPYQRGIELFNAGYYWEAHEAWEGLWLAAGRQGAIAEFLQALIKLAAAGLKIRQGQPDAARSLAGSAAEHFAHVSQSAATMAGFAMEDLIVKAKSVRQTPPPTGAPKQGTQVVFGWQLQPRSGQAVSDSHSQAT